MNLHEEELRNALRALAHASPEIAPPAIEERLLKAFRERQKPRKLITRVAGTIAAGAVAAGLAAMFWIPPQPPKPVAHMVVPAPPPLAVQAPKPVAVAPKLVAQRRSRPVRPRVPAPAVPEVATKFYALPDADIFAPVEDATVVRVQLPRSAMRMVGLPVNEERAGERIRADVVLGQDGIARAVRFVQ
jgi:hypothetical protein